MDIPLWSIVTLATELVVTASVLAIIWRAYATGRFMTMFAWWVLGYEFLFNVSYMASREAHAATRTLDPYLTGLAIFHGVFSLVMFLSLVIFFFVAWRRYGRGENFFAIHPRFTVLFVTAWSISILSGVLLFVQLYLL